MSEIHSIDGREDGWSIDLSIKDMGKCFVRNGFASMSLAAPRDRNSSGSESYSYEALAVPAGDL